MSTEQLQEELQKADITEDQLEGLIKQSQANFGNNEITIEVVQDHEEVLKRLADDGAVGKIVDPDMKGRVDQLTEIELAAGNFAYYLPVLKRLIGGLSAKAAARVLMRLAEFPFGSTKNVDEMGFTDKEEKTAFMLFYELNALKNVMIQHVMKQAGEAKETENGITEQAQT